MAVAITNTPTLPRGEREAFAAFSAARLLVLGGILLIVAGMVFGDVFAVFVLHPNAGRIQYALSAAADAVAVQHPQEVTSNFGAIGSLLENRGTKVDAHVHLIDFGYLAIILALLQPYFVLSELSRRVWAQVLLSGSIALPVSVFLIHYVGLQYSPLSSIGWASIVADLAGLLVIVATVAFGWSLWQGLRRHSAAPPLGIFEVRSRAGRILLAGGAALILLGFAHGAWYAATSLYPHETQEVSLLDTIRSQAGEANRAAASAAISEYGELQAAKAVNIAAHAHAINFGVLAMLLAFVQRYVFLDDRWRRRWALLLLTGSLMLPVFVLLELRWGLLAGAIADVGGLLVVIALIAMLAGVLRYTGVADAAEAAR
jgi:hypothetical protein